MCRAQQGETPMQVAPPKIPYSFSALEPAMSRETLWLHFSRHHHACFESAMALFGRHASGRTELEDLIVQTARVPSQAKLSRLLAGLWNHHMFWGSMRPAGGGAPNGPVANLIRRRFGTYDNFVLKFRQAAAGLYGSGWVWLTWHHGDLKSKPPQTRNPRSWTARRYCSRSICGNTPITWIIKTAARSMFEHFLRNWSTGTSRTAI